VGQGLGEKESECDLLNQPATIIETDWICQRNITSILFVLHMLTTGTPDSSPEGDKPASAT